MLCGITSWKSHSNVQASFDICQRLVMNILPAILIENFYEFTLAQVIMLMNWWQWNILCYTEKATPGKTWKKSNSKPLLEMFCEIFYHQLMLLLISMIMGWFSFTSYLALKTLNTFPLVRKTTDFNQSSAFGTV